MPGRAKLFSTPDLERRLKQLPKVSVTGLEQPNSHNCPVFGLKSKGIYRTESKRGAVSVHKCSCNSNLVYSKCDWRMEKRVPFHVLHAWRKANPILKQQPVTSSCEQAEFKRRLSFSPPNAALSVYRGIESWRSRAGSELPRSHLVLRQHHLYQTILCKSIVQSLSKTTVSPDAAQDMAS